MTSAFMPVYRFWAFMPVYHVLMMTRPDQTRQLWQLWRLNTDFNAEFAQLMSSFPFVCLFVLYCLYIGGLHHHRSNCDRRPLPRFLPTSLITFCPRFFNPHFLLKLAPTFSLHSRLILLLQSHRGFLLPALHDIHITFTLFRLFWTNCGTWVSQNKQAQKVLKGP